MQPLCLNLDRAAIRLFPNQGPGNLAEQAKARHRSARSLRQSAAKQQLCVSKTHIGVVCDDQAAQKMLPQLILLSAHSMSQAALRELPTEMQENVLLSRAQCWLLAADC